jgi:nicotinamide-nucleotide amidase
LTLSGGDASIRRMRDAETIAIGSELLLGGRTDTNSLFLTASLADHGLEVRFKTVVGDHVPDIAKALRIAAQRADVIVLTGGLGPTRDDVTREAVAQVTGLPLRRHPVALASMGRRLTAWGRTLTAAQFRQVWTPAGAQVLQNPIGSAPGFALRWRKVLLVALPGVPVEAEQMFILGAAPWLKPRLAAGRHPLRIGRRLLHTFGLPEIEVQELIRPVLQPNPDIHVGYLASPRGVAVSFTARAENGPASRTMDARLDRLVRASRRVLGSHLYAEGPETMEEVVGRALLKRGWSVAVAESCTGGLIGHRLTEVPGSSAYVDRVAVCYSNRAKVEWLGVSAPLIRRVGAVSRAVAVAMARGIRRRSRVQVGLSITGIAGPGGATADKPVGLVYVGLDARVRSRGNPISATVAREFRFHGSRDMIKLRASQAALDTLRRWLEEQAVL